MLSSKKIVEDFKGNRDWRVKENASVAPSYGALGKYVLGEVYKDYWLREIYTKEIVEAYREGFMHIHDLGGLTGYCAGYSLRAILEKGVVGIPNIPKSKPARHFGAVINQICNLVTIFQNEIMGAVALSSLDTFLAPYIAHDKLSYDQVKQSVQNLIFSLNSNSRMGAEPAFTNFTLDVTPPTDLIDQPVLFGGEYLIDHTYREYQREMDLFNRAFCENMLEGDADGVPFAYPIPTYNIHPRFDWDNVNNELLWEMTGKYGTPYFSNFINTDMKPEDTRSMCCRLRLDKRELLKRNGGLFGSGDSTGSIGVVTLDLPKFAYLASGDKDEYFTIIEHYMNLAKDSLEIKRTYLTEEVLNAHELPAFESYIGSFNNFFSTIGYIGLSEAAVNLIGKDITTPEGKALSEETLNLMRGLLQDFQVDTGNLYNLEATPAESTCYRLAKIDKEQFPSIFTQGTDRAPYYTNSCHIPVKQIDTIMGTALHQESLQELHTGGTVVHFYLDGPITGKVAKQIVRTVINGTKLPYISLSPLNRICPNCGFSWESGDKCSRCGSPFEKYQRITGYRRNVKYFNIGKEEEFNERHQIDTSKLSI